MSTKLLNVFSDENTGLQKQIGCMNGLFQMFDGRHLFTGRHHYATNQKRLASGNSTLQNSSSGADRDACPPEIVLSKHRSKSCNENQKKFIDSSRASFSSSSYSSFSSLDCNKSTQHDTPSLAQSTFPEFSKDSPRLISSGNYARYIYQEPSINSSKTSSVQNGKHSTGFRDVKESIHRETRGLSVKTSTKEEVSNKVLKYKDSPRPMSPYTIKDGSDLTGKSRMPMDLNDTLRVLEKLKETAWNSSEPYQDSPFCPRSREAHRFSFDGRESSQINKAANKIKEQTRLSLDSRAASETSGMHQRFSAASSMLLELGSDKSRPSVVAKLMGLEAMPNLSINVTSSAKKDCQSFSPQRSSNFRSKSSQPVRDSKQDQDTLKSLKDSCKVQPKQSVSFIKPVSTSRVPNEAAPWRQHGRVSSPQRARTAYREARMKQHNESVYREIEKRVKELVLRDSNKNLGALKQLLEAMQVKGLLETEKDEDQQHSEVSVQKNCIIQSSRSANVRSSHSTRRVPLLIKGSNTAKVFESPIVVIKSAKSLGRTGCSTSSVNPPEGQPGLRKLRTTDSAVKKDLQNARTDKDKSPKVSVEFSPRTQHLPIEKNGSSPKTSNSLSPRLQQRKLELERKSCSSMSSSVSYNPRSPSANRQSLELVSARGKLSPKLTQVQRNCAPLNGTGSELKTLNQQGDEIFLRSDSSNTLASQVDIVMASAHQHAEMDINLLQSRKSPSDKSALSAAAVAKHEKSLLSSDEYASPRKFVDVVSDQPSPISVLDASFYQEDLPPSPVKKISSAFKDNETLALTACWNPDSLNDSPKCNLSSETNHEKSETIKNQALDFRNLISSSDEPPTIDQLTSLTETQNADRRYVLEILLASGLMLRDLSSPQLILTRPQLHPSGHPINSDLFFILEQTKSYSISKLEAIHKAEVRLKPDQEKLRRKLVFDLVNEILAKKLELANMELCSKPLNSCRKIASRIPSGQYLLKELCLEIEGLHADCKNGDNLDDDNTVTGEEILRQLEGWEHSGCETSEVVLEIERLIFKDLIDEILVSKSAYCFQAKRNRRRRQLFAM